MTFQLGVYSFGNTPGGPAAAASDTGQAVRDLLQAIKLADDVGLDFFGVGEHHTAPMPVSSPATVIAAAAASTRQIHLGSAVTVLGTDDPVRVYQQHATAAALAPGRIEITAGRGSSTESFGLFGYRLEDYDELYAAKLDLLLAINGNERVSWDGPFRSLPLNDALVVPRAVPPLKIWLGTGGSPESTLRAGALGLPVFYGVLGGDAAHWARLAGLYRHAAARSGHSDGGLDIAIATHGFVGADATEAKEKFYQHESAMFAAAMAARGGVAPSRDQLLRNYAPGGMTFVGDPQEIADRIVAFQRVVGHSRQMLQMDVGGMPHDDVLAAIELLGTEVLPRIRAALG